MSKRRGTWHESMLGGGHTSLRDVVHRAHQGVALVSIALAGLLLLLIGVAALRVYMENNLQLMARSLSYTVEAAVVFGDQTEAQQMIERLARDGGVADARVVMANGRVFAQWQPKQGHMDLHLGQALARAVSLEAASAPIVYDSRPVGTVTLQSDGLGLLRFVLAGLAALALCTTVSGFVGIALARRMLRDIVTPLQHLEHVARAVHRDRALGERVPPARIAELRELGDDFNALLDELEARQANLQQQNSALEHQVHHDTLTGVSTRLYFEQRLRASLASAAAQSSQLAVLFIDLDHFKRVNDTFGHAAGDILLVTVAQRIRAQVRDSDLVARQSGDEFIVLLPSVRDALDAMRIADKIADAMRAPIPLPGGHALRQTLSIGVAVYPEHGQTMEVLVEAADAAMYQAKTARRGSVQVAREPEIIPK
ncbi:MAG: diguanylate cyclase [Acidovorax sp.]